MIGRIKNILQLISILCISSCGFVSSKNINDEENKAMSVGSILQNPTTKTNLKVEEADSSTQIGPKPSEKIKDDSKNQIIEPAIALVILDDDEIINKTLKLSRLLNKNGITPRIYAGVGLGAIVATALAFNMSADEIEWELFAQERKGIKDKKEKAKSLLKKVIDKDIGQSFHVLALQNSKGIWKTRGKLNNAINFHLDSSGIRKWPIGEIKNKIGADIVIKVNPNEETSTIEEIEENIVFWKKSKS